MLKRLYPIAAILVAAISITLVSVPSARADYVYCNPATNECYTVIEQPAIDPISDGDSKTGFTPGPVTCLYERDGKNVKVPCTTTDEDYWSNNRQCYVSLAPSNFQSDPPSGGAEGGAWYLCAPYEGPLECDPATETCRGPYGGTFWSDTPPPGIETLSPGQAALRLVKTFQLRGIDVGFAPDPNTPNARSYVGVPIWMWVDNPRPLSFGPYSETATLGGVTVTATAKVTSIIWNMGDGESVACAGAGTEFKVAYGAVPSPTCGYQYSRTSDNQPRGRYAVTATSQWQVTWAGGGDEGMIPLTTQSATTVDVNELQSVNVSPSTGN